MSYASKQSVVVSQSGDWDTSLADRGSLRSQRPAPIRRKSADDYSLLEVTLVDKPPDLLLEPPSAVRVIHEHVEARACGRQQDDSIR